MTVITKTINDMPLKDVVMVALEQSHRNTVEAIKMCRQYGDERFVGFALSLSAIDLAQRVLNGINATIPDDLGAT